VFTCGAVAEDDGTVKIYWGGADTVMCVGEANISDLVALCLDRGRPAKWAWRNHKLSYPANITVVVDAGTALLKVCRKLRDPHRSACVDSIVMEILLPTNPKATE
jgi:hypothetical protein